MSTRGGSAVVVVLVAIVLTLCGTAKAESLLDRAIQGDSSSEPATYPSQPVAPSPSNSSSGPATGSPASESNPRHAPLPATVGATAPLAAAVESFGNTAIGRRFRAATNAFPAFCHDWQDKLVAREQYNMQRINWHLDHGLETGTYVGYSPIISCTTKLSTNGIPIGKLTYQEINYILSGKTVEEAMHSKPQRTGITNTLEIFRWDKSHWLY